jgi:hypothetical protein
VKYTEEVLKKAHLHSIHHKHEILDSDLCGCFHCWKTFTPDQIEDWTDVGTVKGPTSICPKCGIDSVIGSASGIPVDDPEFIRDMSRYWFGGQL